jgi:hypothetical protein
MSESKAAQAPPATSRRLLLRASCQLEVGAPMPQIKMTWTRMPAEENGWPSTAR